MVKHLYISLQKSDSDHKLHYITDFQGLRISVENRKGSIRRGKNKAGIEWQTKMFWPYGRIQRTEGADGDALDCYVGPNPHAAMAFIVHQKNDKGGFDEDKVMLGFDSEEHARDAYLAHYDTYKFLGEITAMPMTEFIEKVKSGKFDRKMLKSLWKEPMAVPGLKKSYVRSYRRHHKGKDVYVSSHHRRGERRVVARRSEDEPWRYTREELSKRLLFHGSGEEIEGQLHGGGFDGVLWTAESPDVAQNYIPASGVLAYFGKPTDYEYDDVVPITSDTVQTILRQMGYRWEVDWDIPNYRPKSFGYLDLPHEKWPRWRDVVDYVENTLGYRPDDNGAWRLKEDWSASSPVIRPADYKAPGRLYIFSGKDKLKIYDLAQRTESDLMEPQYYKTDLFRKLIEQGFDAVRIHDWAQSEKLGNLGHTSIGLFPSALRKLHEMCISAVNYDWDVSTERVYTPEFVEWHRRQVERAIQEGKNVPTAVRVEVGLNAAKSLRLVLRKSNPNWREEPRDENGRWAKGGAKRHGHDDGTLRGKKGGERYSRKSEEEKYFAELAYVEFRESLTPDEIGVGNRLLGFFNEYPNAREKECDAFLSELWPEMGFKRKSDLKKIAMSFTDKLIRYRLERHKSLAPLIGASPQPEVLGGQDQGPSHSPSERRRHRLVLCRSLRTQPCHSHAEQERNSCAPSAAPPSSKRKLIIPQKGALSKSHIKGHYRVVNGKRVWVKPHEDSRSKDMINRQSWDMTQAAEQKIEQVIRNINRRKYSKLVSLDYANTGVELFNENQFAMDLEISSSDLESIIPVRRMPSQFGGKGIMRKPTAEELRSAIPKLSDYLRHSVARFNIRRGKPVPPEVLADYPDLAEKIKDVKKSVPVVVLEMEIA